MIIETDTETNAELLERRKNVKEMISERSKRLDRMKPSYAKDTAARFLGSLTFALLQIESKMRDRNLSPRYMDS